MRIPLIVKQIALVVGLQIPDGWKLSQPIQGPDSGYDGGGLLVKYQDGTIVIQTCEDDETTMDTVSALVDQYRLLLLNNNSMTMTVAQLRYQVTVQDAEGLMSNVAPVLGMVRQGPGYVNDNSQQPHLVEDMHIRDSELVLELVYGIRPNDPLLYTCLSTLEICLGEPIICNVPLVMQV